MDMRPDLLSLLLLWGSVARAEVLVQPGFDAKKVLGPKLCLAGVG